MMREITERLSKRLSEVREKGKLSGDQASDWYQAERAIGRILAGDEPLCKWEWLLSKEDCEFLAQEIKEIHGQCFRIYHDVMHYCEKINLELDQGNIRHAQEILSSLCEHSRANMFVEMKHGQ